MKNIFLSVVIILATIHTAFPQESTYIKKWYVNENLPESNYSRNLNYEVKGSYIRSVKKGKLYDARYLNEISPGYPVNWIKNYVSTEIQVTSNGKKVTAKGNNAMLSPGQKNIITTADLGTDILIDVKYKYKNSATNITEDGRVYFSVTIIPEVEAQFPGGHTQLMKYLEVNAMKKIAEETPAEFQEGSLNFTVNEDGNIENVQMKKSTGNTDIDDFLIQTFYKMPKWKAAENSAGKKVKQDFEFNFGGGGC